MSDSINTNTKIGGGGFHHVAIRTRDFDESVAFYSEGLGFVEKLQWGAPGKRAVLLDTGDGNYLEIFERPAESWSDTDPAILHFALRTNDVDAAYAAALAAGATPEREPCSIGVKPDPPTTFRIAFVKGLDGEVIEFFHHPEL